MEVPRVIKSTLRCGASLLLAATMSSCAGSDVSPVQGVNTLAERPTPSPVVKLPLELIQYYPELSNLQPKEGGILRTPNSVTRWINYSTARLNITDATAAYRFLEDFAVEQAAAGAQVENSPSGPLSFLVEPNSSPEKSLIIAPTKAAFSSWLQKFITDEPTNVSITHGLTTLKNPVVSFLWVNGAAPDSISRIFGSNQNGANSIFFTEACQSRVKTSVNNSFNLLFQEMTCNSIGYAMAFKASSLTGRSFPDYQRFAQSTVIGPGNLAPTQRKNQLLAFDEAEYNKVPILRPLRF